MTNSKQPQAICLVDSLLQIFDSNMPAQPTFTHFNTAYFVSNNAGDVLKSISTGCSWVAATSMCSMNEINGSFKIRCNSTAHDTINYMAIGICSQYDVRTAQNISGGNKQVLGIAHFMITTHHPAIISFDGNGNELTNHQNIDSFSVGDVIQVQMDTQRNTAFFSKNDGQTYSIPIRGNIVQYPAVFCCSCKGNEFEFIP
eukprot:425343_1